MTPFALGRALYTTTVRESRQFKCSHLDHARMQYSCELYANYCIVLTDLDSISNQKLLVGQNSASKVPLHSPCVCLQPSATLIRQLHLPSCIWSHSNVLSAPLTRESRCANTSGHCHNEVLQPPAFRALFRHIVASLTFYPFVLPSEAFVRCNTKHRCSFKRLEIICNCVLFKADICICQTIVCHT